MLAWESLPTIPCVPGRVVFPQIRAALPHPDFQRDHKTTSIFAFKCERALLHPDCYWDHLSSLLVLTAVGLN